MIESLLLFHLRPARRKARTTAVLEALSLLDGLEATAPARGPLGEKPVFWVALPSERLPEARTLLPRLGYTNAVDLIEPALGSVGAVRRDASTVRWRGAEHVVTRLYEEDAVAVRESAPDRRPFVLERRGAVREVRGYRGDSGPLSRRGLPFYDARLLVNLASCPGVRRLLDPYAGVGGVIIEAVAAGLQAMSCDVDPALRRGLGRLGADHWVGDADRLPLQDNSVAGIATEPPFAVDATDAIVESMRELRRVLAPSGRLAMLAGERQAEALTIAGADLQLNLLHSAAIDRKGTACGLLVWEKPA